jgi:hypothetical protein
MRADAECKSENAECRSEMQKQVRIFNHSSTQDPSPLIWQQFNVVRHDVSI